MKINWFRIIFCSVLCASIAGIGMPIYVGIIGLAVGFFMSLIIETA